MITRASIPTLVKYGPKKPAKTKTKSNMRVAYMDDSIVKRKSNAKSR